MLHTGIDRNCVTGSGEILSQYLTIIPKYFLSVWSLPISHNRVKGDVQYALMTSELSAGARACLTIAVVLVLPEANSCAIFGIREHYFT